MSFLKNILEEKRYEEEIATLREEYEDLLEQFEGLVQEYGITISEDALQDINEGITDFSPNMSIGEIFDEAQRRFNTAKWALGLTNKLRNPEDRKKHRRIVLTAINQIRAVINKLVMQLTKEVKDESESAYDADTDNMQRKIETRPRMSRFF